MDGRDVIAHWSAMDPGAMAALDPVFDAVVVNLVLITIPDWRAALEACVAALAPGGRLVVSLTHPCFEEGSYFDEHVLDRPVAPERHRPLSSYLTAIARAGLRIAEVAEPRLAPEQVPDDDPAAERLTREPAFLIVCADRE